MRVTPVKYLYDRFTKNKYYPITHARAVIVGDESSVYDELTLIEKQLELMKKTLPSTRVVDSVTKLRDYLYTVTCVEDFNYQKANAWIKDKYKSFSGSCTGVRYGKYHMRNFDFPYSNYASFVVQTRATEKRFASIGTTSSIPITVDMIKNKEDSEYWDYLPYMMSDGINSEGVAIQINVVPAGDYERTTGTRPGALQIGAQEIVRYVLDNARTAYDGVQLIQGVDIWAPDKNGRNYEYHWLISDKTESYIVEIYNNEIKVQKFNRNDTDCIMTNFYSYNMTHSNGTINPYTVPAHSAGLERWELVYTSLQDTPVDNFNPKAMANWLHYTKVYTRSTSPFWYTDFTGDYSAEGGPDLTVTTPHSSFDGVINASITAYENRERENPITWQTVHSVIYNLDDGTMEIAVQEDYDHWITCSVYGFLR